MISKIQKDETNSVVKATCDHYFTNFVSVAKETLIENIESKIERLANCNFTLPAGAENICPWLVEMQAFDNGKNYLLI